MRQDDRVRARPLIALVLLWLAPHLAAENTLHRYEASRVSMACTYAIVVYGDDARALPGVVEAAFDEVDRIDRLMSHYKPDSPLSRLNREASARGVEVEPELFDLIEEALRYSRDSGGAFDITVGPLMRAWGFFQGEGRVPADGEIADLRRRVGFEHVVLDRRNRTIAFDRPGIELDLGGIAKGYAVDRAVGVLRQHGVTTALVSAGGSTIFGAGAPPGRGGWDVTIQDPIDPRRAALTVRLQDGALSVSGSSEKSFEAGGVRYSHIMDPRTGRPVQGLLSVAVLTGTGTAGDALDNVFFVQGVEKTREQVKRLAATEAYFFAPDSRDKWKMVHVARDQ
jgi:thiamine biosynthesis lipoprotein